MLLITPQDVLATSTPDPLFKIIWKWNRPERFKMFFWKILNEGLLTNEERCRRGLTGNSACPRCHVETRSDPI